VHAATSLLFTALTRMWTDFRQFIAAQARAAFFNARAGFSLIACEIRERSAL
jgi:hypothetical protein